MSDRVRDRSCVLFASRRIYCISCSGVFWLWIFSSLLWYHPQNDLRVCRSWNNHHSMSDGSACDIAGISSRDNGSSHNSLWGRSRSFHHSYFSLRHVFVPFFYGTVKTAIQTSALCSIEYVATVLTFPLYYHFFRHCLFPPLVLVCSLLGTFPTPRALLLSTNADILHPALSIDRLSPWVFGLPSFRELSRTTNKNGMAVYADGRKIDTWIQAGYAYALHVCILCPLEISLST